MASTPGSERVRRKPRLSADIDQLLSQMNDIDFGIGGDDEDDEQDGPEKAPQPFETPERGTDMASPQLVEPRSPLDSSADSSPSLAEQEQHQDNGMLAVQGDAHRGILSADLTALGSMMTGLR